ncbi:PREDICTED: kinesin-like protein KIF6 [Eufriesea mexicana]|uniref:kinesin-like protein KIF6 n=1 Tax=Eufriesea mexicana TaxID=516756 RepID=UPI00083C002A|nr:PREDICTED: kinesin-like protein KIF6 [Eufriesea mexicana]
MVKNAIKVYARLKPEKCRKNTLNYQVLHRPKKNLAEDYLILVSRNQKSKEYPDNRPESWNFSFFQIFEESSTQDDVFDNVARPVLESALDGYNGTVFAYGQTASGKTHTITGKLDDEYRGVIPRSLQYLFEEIRKRPENVYSIEVAYLEIYNEIGYDLLDRRQLREFAVTRLEDLPRINILEDEFGRLHTRNLSFHSVKNVDDAFELLLLGNNNRVTADTPMNRQSSRSHCIFTIVVSTKEFGAEQYKQAKVHLVDLAGSERVYKCSITGTILTEAKHINLSLHYLEQVIVSLGQESVGHIPYRNSLLTSILRDSLGGNCLTVMLATMSVTSSDLEETVSTCRFAQRVALIKNYLKLNLETNIESENALLRAEIERLRQQIQALKKQSEPISEDLNAEDKRNLDSVIRRFLESNEQVSWDYDPKKVQYCFESFKRAFELSKDPKSYLRKLEYYKDLVNQRDQEISLLIDKIKKEKDKQCKDANDDTSVINNIRNDKRIIERDSTVNHVSPKKHKRRTKISNRTKINYNENVCDDDSVSRNKSFVTDTLTPELLSCNVVNLTLTDLIEDKNETTDQQLSEKANGIGQQSLPKLERQQKSVKKKRSNPTESKMKEQSEQSRVESQSAKAKIITKETSAFIETDISTPVYQKFLSFNAHSPKTPLTFKEDMKNGKEDFDRKLNLDENSNHFEDLPLTGDPEIDEEIIAFYKAKRSGGIY